MGTNNVKQVHQLLTSLGIHTAQKVPRHWNGDRGDVIIMVGFDDLLKTIKVYYQKTTLKNASNQLNIICYPFNLGSNRIQVMSPKFYYTVVNITCKEIMKHIRKWLGNSLFPEWYHVLRAIIDKYYFPSSNYCLSTFSEDRPYAFHIKLYDNVKILHIKQELCKIIGDAKDLERIDDNYVTWISVGVGPTINVYHRNS